MNPVIVQSEHMVHEIPPQQKVDEGVGQYNVKELAGNVSEHHANVNCESKENNAMILNQILSDNNNNKYSMASSPPKETLCEDKTSIQGQFGWTQFDDVFIPYLMRFEKKYVSVDMIQSKIFFKFTKYFSRDLYSCGLIEKFHMSFTEAKLLNEINSVHCDNYFGNKVYTSEDYIIKLSSANEMYEFLNFCYNKLIKKDTNVHKRCGFIDIDGSCVPYVWFKDMQCVPVFFFDGQCKYLDEQVIQLKGFHLSYLKLLCKIQGLKKEFFDIGSVPVVDIEFVKKLFTPDTLFKECWPTEYCIKSLLNISPVGDDPNVLNKNTQENIQQQNIDQLSQQNQIVEQSSQQNVQTVDQLPEIQNKQTVDQLPLKQNQQHITQLQQRQNLQSADQLNQKLIPEPVKQLETLVSTQKFSMINKRYSATYRPYPKKPIKPPKNLLIHSQNIEASTYPKTGSLQFRIMPIQNGTVQSDDLGKNQNGINSNMFQIPDYSPNKNICYFLIRSQIEDKILQHCTNIDPYHTNIIIVTLEEVSDAFKIHLNALVQVISDLRINIYWPNKEQLRLLSACRRNSANGLIIVQDLKDHLSKIKSKSFTWYNVKSS